MKKPVSTTPSLVDTLTRKTAVQLRTLARDYCVKGVSTMKKAELVDAVLAALLEPNRLAELLYILDGETWALFRTAAASETPVEPNTPGYQLLTELCYMAATVQEGRTLCYVPGKVKAVFATLCTDGFLMRKARFDLLHAYASAAVNLYGVIHVDELIRLFNCQNAEPVTEEELFSVLLRHIVVDSMYCFWEEYLVCDDFEENDFRDVPDLLARVGGKPRYIPEKSEFLRYALWDYFEQTEQTRAMEQYLIRELRQPPSKAAEIVSELHFACAVEARTQQKFDVFQEYGIRLTEKQLSKIITLLTNLSNSTRLWPNNGHTPDEIFKAFDRPLLKPPPKSDKAVKVGRNELCPCGSGRKYKKCCGR